jgi:hypothetical protein
LSDLVVLLIILLSILSASIALLWWWFRPRLDGSLQGEGIARATQGRSANQRKQAFVKPLITDQVEPQTPGWRLQVLFFSLALIIYLTTRFVGLGRFPITFFADEAASTVLASKLIENGLRFDGEILPTYFYNVDKYSLSATVYLQVVPYLLIGKTVFATRAASVLVSLIGVLAISLTLKEIFKTPFWWTAALWLLLSPGWFMHSRTAFETPIASAFFASFILFYLLYLYESPRYFPFVVLSAAATFYAYNPARIIVASAVLFLAISDRKYHLSNLRVIVNHWWLILLSLFPYVRFFFQHPFAAQDQLLLLNSYWVRDLSILQKITQFLKEFMRGISPLYWYFPHEMDLARHTMKGYGHILWVVLPFTLWGIYIAWRGRKMSAYRALLILLVCATFGGAIVQTAVTRSLPVIMPIVILSALGFSDLVRRSLRSEKARIWASFGVLVIAGCIGIVITGDALQNGPTWYSDYGLYGMQYGSPEVFHEIKTISERSPEMRIIASPLWANGTSMLARFFLDDLDPLWWGVITDFLSEGYPIDETDLFVMLPNEYAQARQNEHVANIDIEKIIYYPDGNPGFYFATVQLLEP